MKIPTTAKYVKFRNTMEDVPRGTLLIQGMPRVGKTLLAARIAEAMVGPNETFLVDFPEEEGTSTLSDINIPYATVNNQMEMDELYAMCVKDIQPKAFVWDSLGAQYAMIQKEIVPSGVMPEDHGKTWNALASRLRRDIIRFKMIPSVQWFIATSLVWPDKDEITGKEGRLQVTLPGQLKSNIYGLFSYNVMVKMDEQGGSMRVLQLQPTVREVAGVRAPISAKIPSMVKYDLAKVEGCSPIIEALKLQRFVSSNETNS